MLENEQIAETLKTLNKRAIFEISRGNYIDAIEAFEQSKSLEETLGLDLQVAESLVNIANANYLMQHHDTAFENLESALKIFKEKRLTNGMYRVYQLWGAIHFQKKDYAEALEKYKDCIKLNLGVEKNAVSLYQVAVTHIKMDDHIQALDYLAKAMAGFERSGDKNRMIECLRQRASLFKMRGRNDLAGHDLIRCSNLQREIEETEGLSE